MQAEIIEISENVAEQRDQHVSSMTSAGGATNPQNRGQARARNHSSNQSVRSVSFSTQRQTHQAGVNPSKHPPPSRGHSVASSGQGSQRQEGSGHP